MQLSATNNFHTVTAETIQEDLVANLTPGAVVSRCNKTRRRAMP